MLKVDKLVLLPVDPVTVFTYWQLSPLRQETLNRHLGVSASQTLTYSLRLWGGKKEEDLKPLRFLKGMAAEGKRYVNGLKAGFFYKVELGYHHAGRVFLLLLTSALLALPPSPTAEEEMAALEELADQANATFNKYAGRS